MGDLEIIDATSQHQNSLPISSDEIMAQLNLWHIQFERFDHVPLKTVEDSKKYNLFSYHLSKVVDISKIYICVITRSKTFY